MKYDIKTPCDGCPFRVNAPPGYLGGEYTAQMIIDHILQEIPFLCHCHVENTVTYYFEDWQERLGEHAQHCAGALIMARRMCKLPRDPEHGRAVADIDATQPILFPPAEFIDYHTNPERFNEFVKAIGKEPAGEAEKRDGPE